MKFVTLFVVASAITSAVAAPSQDLDKRGRRLRWPTSNAGKAVAVGAISGAVFGGVLTGAEALKNRKGGDDDEAHGNLKPVNRHIQSIEKRAKVKDIMIGSFFQGISFGAAFAAIDAVRMKMHRSSEEKRLKELQAQGLKPVNS